MTKNPEFGPPQIEFIPDHTNQCESRWLITPHMLTLDVYSMGNTSSAIRNIAVDTRTVGYGNGR
jgi:hypothetical protein